MKNLNKVLLLCSTLLGATCVKAQVDPHFSQYYSYPMWLNPAMTGAIDGDYRVGANYRTQWNNIADPFATIGAAAEFVTNKNLNLGINLMNQSAGNAGYNFFTGYVSASYTGIRFGAQGHQRLAIGLQAGLMNRRFDPSKFQFSDQWNPSTGYDPNAPTTEVMTRNSKATFDAGAGILYYDADPAKSLNAFIGVSAFHLTRPEDPFIYGKKETLPIRYAVHGGVRFVISDMITITPNALYMKQGTSNEKMVGAYAQIKASTFADFLIGGNYRFEDAITPFVGFHYEHMVLGLSYDTNVSSLKNLARSSNAFEISLSFTGRKSRALPGDAFICPRL